MHVIECLLEITGGLVWLIVGGILSKEGLIAAVRTGSLIRCQLSAMKAGHRQPKWHRLPRTLLSTWWDFLMSDRLTITGRNYEWRGVGDWTVTARVAPAA